MENQDRLEQRYDGIPYPSAPVSQSRPDHLAVVARLAGVSAAATEASSLLELGCGDGANLIPHALANPGGTYVGVDISTVQIQRGLEDLLALGLDNCALHAGDLSELSLELGRFDYIVAAGVLSWVDEPVRTALFGAIADHLAEEGVAFVSYNAMPGWHHHERLRDVLLHHTRDCETSAERLVQAKQLLVWLRPIWSERGDPTLLAAFGRIDAGGDAYLFHEYLAPINQAFWLEQVAGMARAAGLYVLGTANLADGPPGPQLQLGPYADLRDFDAVVLGRRPPSPQSLESLLGGLRVSADLQPDGDGFSLAGATTVQSPNPNTRLVLQQLGRAYPAAVLVAELLDPLGDEAAEVGADLLALIDAGVCGLHVSSPAVAVTLPDHPRTTALARLQAARQDWVTDLWHRKVLVRADQRELLCLLDGSRTAAEVEAQLGRPVLPTLRNFARNGLLEAE